MIVWGSASGAEPRTCILLYYYFGKLERLHMKNEGKKKLGSKLSKKKESTSVPGLNRIDTEKLRMLHEKEDLILEEWYQIWLQEYKAVTVKQGTLESYECMYQYYVGPEFGKRLLSEIRSEEIQCFYNELARVGYSEATLSLVHVLVGSMLKQAYRTGRISKNPAEFITVPRGSAGKEPRALTTVQQELLQHYAHGHEIEGIIVIALTTGMRIGEITGLEWKNIDLKNKEIKVCGTLKYTREGIFFKDTPKTKSSRRTIPMLPQVEQMFRKLWDVQHYEKTAERETWNPVKGLENLIFLRRYGIPFTGQHVRQQLNHITSQINEEHPEVKIGHISPHVLRHTFATRALEQGMAPKVVQEILGHSSITMTMDLYTHVLPQMRIEEIRKLEQCF